MTQIDPILINKIQKCLALSASPNENEAKLAMEKVQELLLKHNLFLEDIGTEFSKEEISDEIFYSDTYVIKWKSYLLQNVTQHNFCTLILVKTLNLVTVKVIGKPTNMMA